MAAFPRPTTQTRTQPAHFLGSPTIRRTHLWPHHTPLGQGTPLLLKRLADELVGGQRNRQGVRQGTARVRLGSDTSAASSPWHYRHFRWWASRPGPATGMRKISLFRGMPNSRAKHGIELRDCGQRQGKTEGEQPSHMLFRRLAFNNTADLGSSAETRGCFWRLYGEISLGRVPNECSQRHTL